MPSKSVAIGAARDQLHGIFEVELREMKEYVGADTQLNGSTPEAVRCWPVRRYYARGQKV